MAREGVIFFILNGIGLLIQDAVVAFNYYILSNVNNKAAESRIRDANVAEESANMTKFNILSQSGIAALAQANQSTPRRFGSQVRLPA